MDESRDWVRIQNLSLSLPLGSMLWNKPGDEQKKQPVLVSVAVPQSVRMTGASDNLEVPHSINYGTLSKVIEAASKSGFPCMEDMADALAAASFEKFPAMTEISLTIEKPKAILHGRSAVFTATRCRDATEGTDKIAIRDLELDTIIGIHPWERASKQKVLVNLSLSVPCYVQTRRAFDFYAFSSHIHKHISASSFLTVEALATSIAHEALEVHQPAPSVNVRLAKPDALVSAEYPEIQLTRTRADLPSAFPMAKPDTERPHVAAIAFGSNIGDRFANIEAALCQLESPTVKVIDTSFLYESKAMYVENQRNFINGACLISTCLEPEALLDALKVTESRIGRTPTFTNGPRVVDLDLIFYDSLVFETLLGSPRPLIIPHVRAFEREFVLRPLADMIPQFIHPKLKLSIGTLLRELISVSSPLIKVMPFPKRRDDSAEECLYWTWGARTHIMAIINTTPDSFSDGGDNLSVRSAMEFVDTFKSRSGSSMVDVIDIGGYSTRPGAIDVSSETEIERTAPTIKAIRSSSDKETKSTLISIDTFRGLVAKAALDAGADIVNDVYGLSKDESITEVVRQAGCPVVLMHSRGDAGHDKNYGSRTIIQGVREELGSRVQRALDAGIRRWNIVVDPGIGFSKTVSDHLILIRNLSDLTRASIHKTGQPHPLSGMPTLIGASRKSFLGRLTGHEEDPKGRLAATLVTHTAAIQQGVDVVRVHDIRPAWDMVIIADHLYRS